MKSEEECVVFFEKVSQFIDSELSEEDKAKFEEHLRECPPCVKYIDSLKILKECVKNGCGGGPEISKLVDECLNKFLKNR